MDKKVRLFSVDVCRNCGNVRREEKENCAVCKQNTWRKARFREI